MKKMLVFGLLAVVGFMSSCSNDFELTAPWEDIPVVYGFLSVQDSIHYVRVEKAFLDPDESALEVAQRADSLYYDNGVLVQLERVDKSETITLERVNGDDEGVPREDGVFASSPNILYKFVLPENNELEGGETVRLKVSRGEKVTSAETILLNANEFLQGSPGNPVKFETDKTTKVSWRIDENSYLFDLKIRMYLEESDPNDPTIFLPKTLEWVVKRNIERDESNNVRAQHIIQGEDFYKFLRNTLDADLPVVRVFRSLDVEVNSGGIELLEFLKVTQANTGITSSQTIPSYTNIDGGFGLFTSRNITVLPNLPLHPETRDSLIGGFYTKNLNFR